jgi:hypothetical protein
MFSNNNLLHIRISISAICAHVGVRTREEPIREDTNLTPSNHHRTPIAQINRKKYRKIRKNIRVKRIRDPSHEKEA